MTISKTTNWKQYSGNGATYQFAYDYLIYAPTHLEVIKTSATGSDTVLSYGVDYTVVGYGTESGGYVEYPIGGTGTKLASGEKITISRTTPLTQAEDLIDQGAVVASRWMAMADRLTIVCQDLQAQVDRALLSPVTAPGGETALTETAADLRYIKLIGGTFTGEPAYGADPSTNNGLVRKLWVVSNYVPIVGGVTLGGSLNMGGNKLTNMAAGSNNTTESCRMAELYAHTHQSGSSQKITPAALDMTGSSNGSFLTVNSNAVQTIQPYNATYTAASISNSTSYVEAQSRSLYVPRASSSVLLIFGCQISALSIASTEFVRLDLQSQCDATQIEQITDWWRQSNGSGVASDVCRYATYMVQYSPGATGTYTFKVNIKYQTGSQTDYTVSSRTLAAFVIG